jgi:hypothetical protein
MRNHEQILSVTHRGFVRSRRQLPIVLAARALVAILLCAQMAHPQVPATTKDAKLSSILSELRQAVPQRNVGGGYDRSAFVTSFSVGNLSRPLRNAILARSMRLSAQAEVQVEIEMSSLSSENLAALKESGVTVEILAEPNAPSRSRRAFSRVPTVQVEVPVEALQVIEDLPFVRFIHLPHYAMLSQGSSSTSTGSLTTQGDAILKAFLLRSTLGVTGAGVRVGVISSGIGGLFQSVCTTCSPVQLSGGTASPIITGDLPGSIKSTGTRSSSASNAPLTEVSNDFLFAAQSFRMSDGDLGDSADGKDGAEGSAMLEIIHHLAPGASLSFANSDSDLEFENAVNYLASQNDVVVDDESFLAPSYDGTSDISQNTAEALNNPANPIRAYVTAAGNYALNHYLGAFVDSGIDGYTYTGEHGDMHLFSGIKPVPPSQSAVSQLNTETVDNQGLGKLPYDPLISLPPNGTVTVGLSWDDRPGASSNDFDLFLVPVQCVPAPGATPPINCTLSGTQVAHSLNAQTGLHDPYEEVAYTNMGNTNESLAVVIQNYQNSASSSTHNFDMFIVGNGAKGTQPNHNYYTASGSIPAQADASGTPVSVITVGAINQAQCDAPATLATPDNCTKQLEVYSGQGPTQITPQTQTATTKPNLTSVDQVCITGAEGFGFDVPTTGVSCPVAQPFTYTPMLFGGTSAAAPHVAAIAALTLQMAPCLLTSSGSQTASAAVFARQTLFTALTGLPAVTTTSGTTSTTTPALEYASPLSGYDFPPTTLTTTSPTSTLTYPYGVPNSAEGWGLVDAYSSASSLLPVPTVQNILAVSTTQPDSNLIASVSAIDSSGATATLTAPLKLTNLSGCPVTDIGWAPQPGSSSTLASGNAQGTQATVAFPIGITPVVVAPSINDGVSYPPFDIVPAANVVVTDFNLTVQPSTPTPVTVPAGTPAIFIITATSLATGPFTNPVSLSCQQTGLPPGAMCVFSPAIVNPSVVSSSGVTQMATSTLTIYTSGVVASVRRLAGSSTRIPRPGPLLYGSVLLCVLGLPRRWRKSVRRWPALTCFAAVACLGISSCGKQTTPMSTSTTYTVTVIGTSSQLVRTATLTFTVQ